MLTAEDRKTLGARIRALRRRQGLKQAQVTQAVKLAPNTLSMMERGVGRKTHEENIEKVLAWFGTSIAKELDTDVAPTDDRLVGLRGEDLEVAHLYHDAHSTVRAAVRDLLQEASGDPGYLTQCVTQLHRLDPAGRAVFERCMTAATTAPALPDQGKNGDPELVTAGSTRPASGRGRT